jgi:hypothetical protein
MVLVLVIGGSAGWLAHGARQQRIAVRAIIKAGGRVEYDGLSETERSLLSSPAAKTVKRNPVLAWLRNTMGVDLFDTVTAVTLDRAGIDDSLMAQVGRLSHVKTLSLRFDDDRRAHLTAEGYARLGELTRLQELIVAGPRDSDGFLPHLDRLSGLRSLRMYQANPSDSDFARIARLRRLDELIVCGRKLTESGFAAISRMESLKHIRIHDCNYVDLTPLRNLKGLESLMLARSEADARPSESMSLAPLHGASNLTLLLLPGFRLGAEGFAPVVGLPRLGTLGVEGDTIGGADLGKLAGMSRLARLELYHARISSLDPIAPILPKLNFLKVTDSSLDDAGIGCLRACSRLVELDLGGSRITDQGLSNISVLINLTRLQIPGTQVGDAGIGKLAKLRFLTDLDLADTTLGDAGLANIAACGDLQNLRLGGTLVTDSGLSTLARLKFLKFVDLRGTRTTPAGRARLAKAMPALQIRF